MFGTSNKNLKDPSSGKKGFADVARRLSTSLTAFGFKGQPNTPTQLSASPLRQSMTTMEETTEGIPQVAEEETEDIRERSVKVTFPKKQTTTDLVTEAQIRNAASTFGKVVDVGMKEKLAVVLFAKSFDAFNFASNHNGVLGEEFKVKFMGTQTAIVSTAPTVLPATSTDPADNTTTTTTTSPKVGHIYSTPTLLPTPTKAEKAAAAAKAAALLADQAVVYAAAVTVQPSATTATAADVDADLESNSFQGIIEGKHRDSKILLMSAAKGNVAAIADIEVVNPEAATTSQPASPSSGWKQAARPSTSLSATAPSSSSPVVRSSGDHGQGRSLGSRSQWSSKDSASPSSSSDERSVDSDEEDAIVIVNDKDSKDHTDDNDDDNESTFSIDMDDLRRDLGMEVKPSVTDGTDPSSALAPDLDYMPITTASSIPHDHNLRSPSPIEVTVQRLPLVKITPTQPNASSKDKTLANEAVNESAAKSKSKLPAMRGLSLSPKRQQEQVSSSLPNDNEEDIGQAPSPPPRTMTLSPKTTNQRPARTTAAVDGRSNESKPDRGSRLDRSSQDTGGGDLSQQTSAAKEPLLSTSTSAAAAAASTASAAAWIAISNSMEEELRAMRKKVVLLEAEAKVRNRERDDFDREVRSSEQYWAIELAALAQRNAKLETENIRLKDAVQQMTVTTARKDAQLAALGESVTFYQVEVHRHQQRQETQLQVDEDSRALPLYPRFLFKPQQQPDHSVDHREKPSSSSPPSKNAAAMVLRATDEEPDHWKSPSASASDSVVADETKSSDMPPLPPPPPPPLALAGSSATTRSLFDDLVATRRQLDDLSRLSSSQSPGLNVHLSSTIKQTRDNGRTATSLSTSSSAPRSSVAVDVSTLTAIARGDFFHHHTDKDNERLFATTSSSNILRYDHDRHHRHAAEREHDDSMKGFDASSFNETMDRIVQLGAPSSSYHKHLLDASASKQPHRSVPSSSSSVTSDQLASIYKPLQLPAFSLATPNKSKSHHNNKEYLRNSTGSINHHSTPLGTMSYYSQYAPASQVGVPISSHRIPNIAAHSPMR